MEVVGEMPPQYLGAYWSSKRAVKTQTGTVMDRRQPSRYQMHSTQMRSLHKAAFLERHRLGEHALVDVGFAEALSIRLWAKPLVRQVRKS